jgi:hypothetical protein
MESLETAVLLENFRITLLEFNVIIQLRGINPRKVLNQRFFVKHVSGHYREFLPTARNTDGHEVSYSKKL